MWIKFCIWCLRDLEKFVPNFRILNKNFFSQIFECSVIFLRSYKSLYHAKLSSKFLFKQIEKAFKIPNFFNNLWGTLKTKKVYFNEIFLYLNLKGILSIWKVHDLFSLKRCIIISLDESCKEKQISPFPLFWSPGEKKNLTFIEHEKGHLGIKLVTLCCSFSLFLQVFLKKKSILIEKGQEVDNFFA